MPAFENDHMTTFLSAGIQHQWKPYCIVYVDNENELLDIMQKAYTDKRKIRIYGAGWSTGGYPISPGSEGIQVILKGDFSKIISENEKTITVGANYDYLSLVQHLESQGQEFRCRVTASTYPDAWKNSYSSSSMKIMTMGGFISCESHDSNEIRLHSLIRSATVYTFYNGRPQATQCSRTKNKDLFNTLVGGLGLTGIIGFVELEKHPISFYKQKVDVEGSTESKFPWSEEHLLRSFKILEKNKSPGETLNGIIGTNTALTFSTIEKIQPEEMNDYVEQNKQDMKTYLANVDRSLWNDWHFNVLNLFWPSFRYYWAVIIQTWFIQQLSTRINFLNNKASDAINEQDYSSLSQLGITDTEEYQLPYCSFSCNKFFIIGLDQNHLQMEFSFPAALKNQVATDLAEMLKNYPPENKELGFNCRWINEDDKDVVFAIGRHNMGPSITVLLSVESRSCFLPMKRWARHYFPLMFKKYNYKMGMHHGMYWYLSPEDWKLSIGDKWTLAEAAMNKYDPHGLFNTIPLSVHEDALFLDVDNPNFDTNTGT